MVGGDWIVGLRLEKRSKTSEPKQFAGIAALPMDYILPNVCPYGQEGYHTFNDITRKSFAKALRKKIRDYQEAA